jgi:hypothetical protein
LVVSIHQPLLYGLGCEHSLMDNLLLFCREGLPSALKEVCFITKPGEKVGEVACGPVVHAACVRTLLRLELLAGLVLGNPVSSRLCFGWWSCQQAP